ncbi:competence protein ComEC [Spinactinospora alkalitolerans]|uniref:Competence protein ComEC n=1 Tax=Spinactinospora alkalitolerans TaxID=687207 RepID=A0A852U2B4_9ACTN|nr:ComEC/Rec2 family competence protein [Spinactinospora alkalitolerans]NYE49093.1 competence protein ComEC [Spinactinospora alkalitolerans]
MSYLGTDAPGVRAPLDLRLCAPAAGTWLVVLLLLGGPPWTAAVVAAVLGCAALVLAPALRLPRGEAAAAAVIAVLVCGAAGALAAGGRLAAVQASPVTSLAEQERRVDMEVVISMDPRPRAGPAQPGRAEYVIEARSTWVVVDGTRVRTRVPVVLLASGPQWRRLVPSQRVVLTGKALAPGTGGLVSALVAVRGPPREVGAPSWAHALAGTARARLREACAPLPQPERGLLPALVVGDVSELDAQAKEDFQATGMTHLLTVSGANLAVLTGTALGLARFCRLPTWCAVAAGGAMIAVFVLVARAEPSVLRAAFMGVIALVALALGRERAGIAALAASVVGLLLFDPGLARSYGFALSVLATGGIVVLAPRWRDRWSARLPRWLAEPVAVTVAAHVACTPVLTVLSAEVSWVAVPANVLAGPMVPVATVGGFAVAGVAVLSVPAAGFLVWVPAAAVTWIGAVADTGARIPHGALPWRADLLGALGLAGLALLLLAVRGRLRRALLAIAGAVAGTAVLVQCAAPMWPPGGWALVACDVGQGDALVLSAGDGRAVVVDAGIDPAPVDRCLRDLGVREVALLVLTHDDADHVGGASGILRDRAVRAALAPSGFGSGPTGRMLAAAGVPLEAGAAGDRFTVGPWHFGVLWPPPGTVADSNDASVVLLARWNPPPESAAAPMTVLLTGDIEEPAQRTLLGEPAIRGVDVLKTPHHGARTQEPAFLAATRPRVTITSVGAGNSYGHPAPGTWRMLTSLTEAGYRTDLHGDIAVLPGPAGPAVAARGPEEHR